MNAFARLGLAEAASPEEVKNRWRELAAQHHPDKGGDAVKFNEVHQAYKEALRIASEPKPCEACKGTGKVSVQRGFNQIKLPCSSCSGAGVMK